MPIIKKIVLIIVASLMLCMFFATPAFADTPRFEEEDPNTSNGLEVSETYDVEYDGIKLEHFDSLKNWVWKLAVDIYGPIFTSDLKALITMDSNGNTQSHRVVKAVNDMLFSDDNNKASILKIVSPVGYGLLILLFYIELSDKVTHDNFSVEQLFKMLIKLFVAVLVISNVFEIYEGFVSLMSELFEQIEKQGAAAGQFAVLQNWHNRISKMNTFDALGNGLNLVIPGIMSGLAMLVIRVLCYGRLLEIGVRVGFSPIGVADLFGETTRSAGVRYLKKLLATLLQGCVMLLLLTLSTTIQYQLIGESALGAAIGTGLQVVVALTTVMAIVKSQSLANEILGL